jgi:NAD(P)H-hydrate epimerase
MERRGYTAAQVRAAEQPLLAAGEPLMRRAASALAAQVRRELARRVPTDPGRVLLFIGSGDNGGDTLFAGAELAASGVRVWAVPVGSRVREDAEAAARAAGVRFEPPERAAELARGADLVLDGILGIGATPPLRGTAREVVAAVLPVVTRNGQPFVIAVDLPSGVDPDDGSVPDAMVLPAGVTVTFGAEKAGLMLSPGRELAGEVRLIDLGLGPALEGVEPVVREECRPEQKPMRVRAQVRGTVQGVGFRVTTAAAARRFGAAGFVRNLPDGSVEVEVEGAPDVVEKLLGWLRIGPPAAHVTDVTTDPLVPRGETGFDIR